MDNNRDVVLDVVKKMNHWYYVIKTSGYYFKRCLSLSIIAQTFLLYAANLNTVKKKHFSKNPPVFFLFWDEKQGREWGVCFLFFIFPRMAGAECFKWKPSAATVEQHWCDWSVLDSTLNLGHSFAARHYLIKSSGYTQLPLATAHR